MLPRLPENGRFIDPFRLMKVTCVCRVSLRLCGVVGLWNEPPEVCNPAPPNTLRATLVEAKTLAGQGAGAGSRILFVSSDGRPAATELLWSLLAFSWQRTELNVNKPPARQPSLLDLEVVSVL